MATAKNLKPKPAAKWSSAYLAPTWAGLLSQVRADATRRLGTADGAPRLLNSDVITCVMGIVATSSGRAAFPLWYQFAAAAYGWGPTDELDLSPARGARLFPADLTGEFWTALSAWARELTADNVKPARLDMDGQFTDATFAGEVRAALQEDGAEATWKIPLPACKDPKTGKPGTPKRGADGRWRCDPVTIDDPITGIAKSLQPLLGLALVVGVLWLMETK